MINQKTEHVLDFEIIVKNIETSRWLTNKISKLSKVEDPTVS